jgi:hypothetical protein
VCQSRNVGSPDGRRAPRRGIGVGGHHSTHRDWRAGIYRTLLTANQGSLGLRPHQQADGARTDLDFTCLDGTILVDVNLRGARLAEAGLEAAFLLNVDLRGADLSYMDLRGASLHGADLRGADLTGAIHDARTHVDESSTDSRTRGRWR